MNAKEGSHMLLCYTIRQNLVAEDFLINVGIDKRAL